MSDCLIHQVNKISDCGIKLKVLSSESAVKPVDYAHFDDYYLLGFIEQGVCSVNLDFKEYLCSEGMVLISQPGQVHQFIRSKDLKAYLLMVDSAFVGNIDKRILDEYAYSRQVPLRIEKSMRLDLQKLMSVLSGWFDKSDEPLVEGMIRNLCTALIGMITFILHEERTVDEVNNRYVEITCAFKELLNEKLSFGKSPSYYASLMNLSAVYLNEAVKAVTGQSTSKNIQSEIILRAKRLLVYSTKNIQEIALDLGFDDAAYFTRLFTKVVGVSPLAFKKKYLK